MTRPTQPIMPVTDTEAAVTMVAAMMMIRRSAFVLTPIVAASSSPIVRMLIRHLSTNRVTRPTTMNGSTIVTSEGFAPVRLPMSQYVIAGSWSDGSAINLVKEQRADHDARENDSKHLVTTCSLRNCNDKQNGDDSK